MPTDTHVILVPLAAAATFIHPGSAIVAAAEEVGQEHLTCYYEGNIYSYDNIKTFEDMAMHAADRQSMRYPTMAMARLPRAELLEVGRYSHDLRRITAVSDPDALLRWAPEAADWLSVFVAK